MINIDSRFLRLVDGDHMWLILHILDMANPTSMSCFPSNKTLCKKTNWNIKKLQRVKDELIEKGVLKISSRKQGAIQSSNLYTIDSDLLGIYVPAKQIVFPLTPSGDMPLDPSVHIPPIPSGVKEVLTNEVLVNTVESNDSTYQKPLFPVNVDLSTRDHLEPRKNKKNQAPANPVFVACVDIWLKEVHPGWGFKAVDGKALNGILAQMRRYSRQKNEVDISDDKLLQFFRHLTTHLPAFYKNQTLSVINSKFDPIVDEIRTGTNANKKQSAAEYIHSLRARG